jgi:hypothetical protein
MISCGLPVVNLQSYHFFDLDDSDLHLHPHYRRHHRRHRPYRLLTFPS